MRIDRDLVSYIVSSNIIQAGDSIDFLEELAVATKSAEVDAEFVIVISQPDVDIQEAIRRQNWILPIQFVVVGNGNTWDQEMFAGLSRANGDFAIVLGGSKEGLSTLIPQMITLARVNNNDIIGIKGNVSIIGRIKSIRAAFLFKTLRHYSITPYSVSNYNDFLITRRALNWVLRDLLLARSILEIYLMPGLKFDFIKTEFRRSHYRLVPDVYSRLATRYTKTPLLILRVCFLITSTLLVITSINAFMVHFYGFNLLNKPEVQIPGWTTLVVILSFGFTVTIYALYVLLRTILHLADEYSLKPKHIVKSVQRP